MKFRINYTLALKIVCLVLGGTAVVFGFVFTFSYLYSSKIILREEKKNAENLTLSVARRLEQEFRSVAKVPQILASFLETTPDIEEQALLRLIRDVVANSPEVFGMTVAFEPYEFSKTLKSYAPYVYRGKEGIEFVQLVTDSYDYFTKDWYHIPQVLQKPTWSDPYFDEGGGNILMTTYSLPFFQIAADGTRTKMRGIVTADISLEWLTKLVSSVRVCRTGYCFIIADTGRYISHPQPEIIMRESIFSRAEELKKPELNEIGQQMIHGASGFVRLGAIFGGEPYYLAYAPIPSPGWSLGAMLPENELYAELTSYHHISALMAVGGIGLLLAVSILVARSIANPLRRMAQVTARVAEGDLDIDLSDIRSRDEVGQLAQAFMRMTHGLKERDRIRDTFGRYLTREVVNRLLEHKDGLRLGGEKREISMIMSDLRGFTALTSTMHPEEVLKFLNRYLGKMVEILIDYHGTIDEIIGDGILAFFGAPEDLEDHPAMAVACALRMQAAMLEINAVNEADGYPRLEMGVAVNTGEVVVGNIGSEKRAKYGAVGSQVNFTGRIESYTVGGQVLVSKSTFDRIASIVDVRRTVRVEMKGISGEVALYDIRAIHGDYDVQLPEEDEAPVALRDNIDVKVFRMDEKIVTGAGVCAWLTHVSMSNAVMVCPEEIGQWENVRLMLLGQQPDPLPGMVYAKVVSVDRTADAYSAALRFTSVPPDAYRLFRSAPRKNGGVGQ